MFKKQPRHNHNTVPILTYWTRRYLLVLLCSLLILAVAAGIWLRVNTYEHTYNLLELRADQLVELYGRAPEDSVFAESLRQREAGAPKFGPPPLPDVVVIADIAGNTQVVKTDQNMAAGSSALYELSPLHRDVLAGQKVREQVQVNSQTWLRAGVPIAQNGTVSKALYISMPAKNVLLQIRRLYGSLALLTGIITLAGWFVLYFLSRRLTRPLREVAAAAQSIAAGNYDPVLPRQVKERELQQLVVSFRNMAFQLKQLEQLRSGLLAGVSHELRTPITSIRGMIQAVHQKVVSGKDAEEFLQISWNEAKRLQQMVEELLDFSSFEAGATPIRGKPVDLCKVVDEAVRQLRALPEFSQVRFEQALPREPVWINGDAGRLRQILLNLFDNGKNASATLIKITLQVNDDQIALDIGDNGKGIPAADQPYIFERFYRGAARQIKGRGLGLGLTISRLLARAHGGDLVLLHTCSDGAKFRLCLARVQE